VNRPDSSQDLFLPDRRLPVSVSLAFYDPAGGTRWVHWRVCDVPRHVLYQMGFCYEHLLPQQIPLTPVRATVHRSVGVWYAFRRYGKRDWCACCRDWATMRRGGRAATAGGAVDNV